MNNLFSVFDPNSFMLLPLNWISFTIPLTLLLSGFWSVSTKNVLMIKKVLFSIAEEFASALPKGTFPGTVMLTLSTFFVIFVNNFLGLFPYIFTATSHLSCTLAMAFPLWAGYMVYNICANPNSVVAHLVPLGSPLGLSPVLVLIELVSTFIRPVTLAVRLAANMVAGHLLITLLSTPAVSIPINLLLIVLLSLVLLTVLESAVATIQAYVFSVLSTLYVAEVNPLK